MNFISLKNNFLKKKSTSENVAFQDLDSRKKEMNYRNKMCMS